MNESAFEQIYTTNHQAVLALLTDKERNNLCWNSVRDQFKLAVWQRMILSNAITPPMAEEFSYQLEKDIFYLSDLRLLARRIGVKPSKSRSGTMRHLILSRALELNLCVSGGTLG